MKRAAHPASNQAGGEGNLDENHPGVPVPAVIRKYRPEDEAAVCRIAADTAFFGQPVEAYLDDRKLFYDFFYAYYTHQEIGHGWVAEIQGQVVGFLMGCPDTRRKGLNWARSDLPIVTSRLLRGKYRFKRKTWIYLYGLLRSVISQELPHVDLDRYPAHLHMNVVAGRRGRGLGRQLLAAYLKQLRLEGSRGVHLSTTSLNLAACRLYEQAGFQLLDARPTRAWERLVDIPVENRMYGMRLSEAI